MKSGSGITNVVRRATATADLLTQEELVAGGKKLIHKVRRYRPQFLAVVGLGAYRTAFNRTKTSVGRQKEKIGDTVLWVLPNPSGLNANYQQKELARLFKELRIASDQSNLRLV